MCIEPAHMTESERLGHQYSLAPYYTCIYHRVHFWPFQTNNQTVPQENTK